MNACEIDAFKVFDKIFYDSFLVIKDKDSNFVYANDTAIRLHGWGSLDNLIGKTDYDIPSAVSELAPQFVEQDSLVVNTQQRIHTLSLGNYVGGMQALIGKKIPFEDYVICIADHFSQTDWQEIGHLLIEKNYAENLKDQSKSFYINYGNDLTPKEQEIVFFLLMGFKAKEISLFLKRSLRTVETHIERIRAKFNATSVQDIIVQAKNRGLQNYLPSSLMNRQFTSVLKNVWKS